MRFQKAGVSVHGCEWNLQVFSDSKLSHTARFIRGNICTRRHVYHCTRKISALQQRERIFSRTVPLYCTKATSNRGNGATFVILEIPAGPAFSKGHSSLCHHPPAPPSFPAAERDRPAVNSVVTSPQHGDRRRHARVTPFGDPPSTPPPLLLDRSKLLPLQHTGTDGPHPFHETTII